MAKKKTSLPKPIVIDDRRPSIVIKKPKGK